MNLKNYLKLIIKIVLIQNFLFFGIIKTNPLNSENNIESLSSEYFRQQGKESFYILGSGDKIYLEVNEKSKELNGIFSINANGLLNLKRLNEIYVEGLTKDELVNLLNKEYGIYVKNPDVKIEILQYRVLKVYVDGEVNNPGLYVLPGSLKTYPAQNNSPSSFLSKDLNNNVNVIPQDPRTPTYSLSNQEFETGKSLVDNYYFPSVIDFLRASGGVTINSDLENIKIIRKNSISNGGSKIQANINLLASLYDNNFSQNIRVFDGDTIIVPKTNKQVLSQVSKAIKSNINPKFINIFVGGKVENPGIIKASKISVLIDAVDSAGGPKTLRGPVRFVRYTNDGKIDRRKFRFNRNAKNGSYTNPYLKDGDLIFIGKSGFNVVSEVVTEITSPFQGLFSAYGLFRAITD